MTKALLDTDTLSSSLKGRYPELDAKVRQYLRVFRYLTVSSVTVAEVVAGLEKINAVDDLASFLRRAEEFEVLPIDVEEGILAGRILGALARSGQKIGDLDPFIAAVAITNRLPLVTNNLRHYERIVALGFPL